MKKQIIFVSPGENYTPEEKIHCIQEIWTRMHSYLLDEEKATGFILYRDEMYKEYETDHEHYLVQLKKTRKSDKYVIRANLPIWNIIAKENADINVLPDWSKKLDVSCYDTIVGCRKVRLAIKEYWKAREIFENLAVIMLPFRPESVHEMLITGSQVFDSILDSTKRDESFRQELDGDYCRIQPFADNYGLAEHWI